MHKENWDDLRFVLAVADYGSVSAAARALGVNHATVLRRVAAFEQRSGAPIFEKTQLGYSVPPERMPVIEAAREVDAAVHGVRRVMATASSPLSGRVRVTSTDAICLSLLPGIISKIIDLAPHVHLEIISSNETLDIARVDADIAIRPAPRLPEPLIGARAGYIDFAAYAASASPKGWLGYGGAISSAPPAVWMAEHLPPERIVATVDSFVTMAHLAENGVGKAILPRFLGDRQSRLRAMQFELPEFKVPLWVTCHPDLAEIPRVKAVHDSLVDQFGQILRQ